MGLTHLDAEGHARMVDVGAKPWTAREAVASGRIAMSAATRQAILDGALPKGDVVAAARLAGIMAAKQTSTLIPLCHPLALTRVGVDIAPDDAAGGLRVTATVAAHGPTGVEMEALTAVSVALLTIYDMAKAVERGMRIVDIGLDAKHGGRGGPWRRDGGSGADGAPSEPSGP